VLNVLYIECICEYVCSYKVGTLKAAESLTSHAANKEVHILYDHVPNKLVPPRSSRRTKWIFLSAVGLTKQQVEQFYEEGTDNVYAALIHDILYC